jgi:hypothetical protein
MGGTGPRRAPLEPREIRSGPLPDSRPAWNLSGPPDRRKSLPPPPTAPAYPHPPPRGRAPSRRGRILAAPAPQAAPGGRRERDVRECVRTPPVSMCEAKIGAGRGLLGAAGKERSDAALGGIPWGQHVARCGSRFVPHARPVDSIRMPPRGGVPRLRSKRLPLAVGRSPMGSTWCRGNRFSRRKQLW